MNVPTTLPERFWAKVDKLAGLDGCWIWTGSRKRPWGYGQFKFVGQSPQRAHRLAWADRFGPIPEGLEIDHQCRVPACLNPEHLRLVTSAQNKENRLAQSNNRSCGIRGVTWYKRHGKWAVKASAKGRRYFGGYYAELADAERAAIALRLEVQTNNVSDYPRAKELGLL